MMVVNKYHWNYWDLTLVSIILIDGKALYWLSQWCGSCSSYGIEITWRAPDHVWESALHLVPLLVLNLENYTVCSQASDVIHLHEKEWHCSGSPATGIEKECLLKPSRKHRLTIGFFPLFFLKYHFLLFCFVTMQNNLLHVEEQRSLFQSIQIFLIFFMLSI